jgi:DNA-binding transcriptional regulator YdaS (Cro superfamily)
MTGIKLAIDLAGGACALAHNLGVTHQAIYTWAKRGWVPMHRALQIETEYGVPRTQLLKPELVAVFIKPVSN